MAARPAALGRRGAEGAFLSGANALPRRTAGLVRHWKRWLYLTHRWIGIVTCLFFAIWFVSGLVMLYVPFPGLSRAEKLERLAPIDWRQVRVQPEVADARSAALEMLGPRPVWRIEDADGARRVVDAAGGRLLLQTEAAEARAIAARFGGAPVAALTSLTRDQWTVAGGYDRDRPLWKADLGGPGGRVLYVSSRGGGVVLDTNARERFWNWLGSIPHWIYPTVIRQNNAVWRQVVMWVSGPCIVGAVTGMWIGVLRTRLGKRRFKGGRTTPYRGWMEWHHWAGLIGGLFLVAWIFSGWLSVDPFRLFASAGIGDAGRAAYAGGGAPAVDLPALAARAGDAKRVELYRAAGRRLVLVERSATASDVLDAATFRPVNLDRAALIAAAPRLMPGAGIAGIDTLRAPDAYWYGVKEPALLPVLRVRYDDPAGTWVHIDPRTGRIVGDMDRRRRVYRWAFDLLHRWDLNVLIANGPARDVVLWLMSMLGLITSITGIRIAWVRLRPNGPLPVRRERPGDQ
jgi:uncharacterized iron-regulated membrane protein